MSVVRLFFAAVTLKLYPDLDILKMYLQTENEAATSKPL